MNTLSIIDSPAPIPGYLAGAAGLCLGFLVGVRGGQGALFGPLPLSRSPSGPGSSLSVWTLGWSFLACSEGSVVSGHPQTCNHLILLFETPLSLGPQLRTSSECISPPPLLHFCSSQSQRLQPSQAVGGTAQPRGRVSTRHRTCLLRPGDLCDLMRNSLCTGVCVMWLQHMCTPYCLCVCT